ncbi:MAG: transcriptional regulator, TraR/DksA family [Bacilli bacterium]|nr:transcriptional regulator, TraR/DksA family [Bacilli bacterium]
MNSLSQDQIKDLEKLLLEEKTNLEKRIDQSNHFGLESSYRESPGELSSYDNHPADTGTELFEQGKDLALNENAENHLREVTEALDRIQKNNYGSCVECGKTIPYERLLVVPETHFCIAHVPERDISEYRPVEEKIMSHPFGRTSLDERSDQNQFDGEDAWQIVESWGNSDSPAMSEDREVHNYNEMFIEADENDGYVEDFESFIATDIYGKEVSIVRNKAYRNYMANQEGEPLLEPELLDNENN